MTSTETKIPKCYRCADEVDIGEGALPIMSIYPGHDHRCGMCPKHPCLCAKPQQVAKPQRMIGGPLKYERRVPNTPLSTPCARCGRLLTRGDDVYLSHGMMYCSFGCAVDDSVSPPSLSFEIPDLRIGTVPPSTSLFAQRRDAGRRQLATLVPLGALESIAHAGEIGLIKYFLDSFRDDGAYPLSKTLNSAARHIMARTSGEKYDVDGSAYLGHPIDHIDMAIWNLAAACEALRVYGARNDDLWYGPGTAKRDKTPEQLEELARDRLARDARVQLVKETDVAHKERLQKLIESLTNAPIQLAANPDPESTGNVHDLNAEFDTHCHHCRVLIARGTNVICRICPGGRLFFCSRAHEAADVAEKQHAASE